jgi:hypothetical protein
MAKTGEVQEDKEKVVFTDCIAVAIAATDAADPNHKWTAKQADTFYQAVLNACAATTATTTTTPKVAAISAA